MTPLFGDYQCYFREQFRLPFDCLNELKPGSMLIQASEKPNSYVVMFNDTKNIPYIKTVRIAGKYFESCGWLYESFGQFLKAHRADVDAQPVPLLNPFDPKWFRKEAANPEALLMKKERAFLVTRVAFDLSQPYRIYFFHTGLSPNLHSIPFAVKNQWVVSRGHYSTFGQLLAKYKLQNYRGINETP